MLRIKITKNIEEYEKGFAAGLSFGKLLGVIFILFVYIILVVMFSKIMPMILSIYISMLFLIPAGLILFYKRNGMNIISLIKIIFKGTEKYQKSTLHNKRLIDELMKKHKAEEGDIYD